MEASLGWGVAAKDVGRFGNLSGPQPLKEGGEEMPDWEIVDQLPEVAPEDAWGGQGGLGCGMSFGDPGLVDCGETIPGIKAVMDRSGVSHAGI